MARPFIIHASARTAVDVLFTDCESDGDRVLLFHSASAGYWVLPGGELMHGERPVDSIQRTVQRFLGRDIREMWHSQSFSRRVGAVVALSWELPGEPVMPVHRLIVYGGQVSCTAVDLQHPGMNGFEFVCPDEVYRRLAPGAVDLFKRGLSTLRDGGAPFIETA